MPDQFARIPPKSTRTAKLRIAERVVGKPRPIDFDDFPAIGGPLDFLINRSLPDLPRNADILTVNLAVLLSQKMGRDAIATILEGLSDVGKRRLTADLQAEYGIKPLHRLPATKEGDE